MAKSLLNGVNEVLKKTKILDSDAGLLTSLTDSGRQTFVDCAVQALNEAVDDLYSTSKISKPNMLAEATITLVTADRDYALNASMILLRREYHLIDETNDHIIPILGEDGYWNTVYNDLGQDDTGLPSFAALRPTDGQLVFDRLPTAAENGRIYKYRYDTDLELVAFDDEFPFNNMVFRAIVPAAAELWKMHQQQEFLTPVYRASMARAARYLRGTPPRSSWLPSRGYGDQTDPLYDSQVQG